MIEALVSGKLIRDPVVKQGAKAVYCNFLLSVGVGDGEPAIVSGIAFGEVAERIGELAKGDAVCVAGSLKPSEWADKATGEIRHGLNLTVNRCLTIADAKRDKPAQEAQPRQSRPAAHSPRPNNRPRPDYRARPEPPPPPDYPDFDDRIPF